MVVEENVNPCLACDLERNCCQKMGLKISEKEFINYFKKFSAILEVLNYRGIFIVSTQNKIPCPYWNSTGCSIYDKRPIDCRIFPYYLHKLVKKKKKVTAFVYGETDCPLKEELFPPIEDVKTLICELVRQIYGHHKHVEFVFGKNLPRSFGIFDPVISRISSWLRKH